MDQTGFPHRSKNVTIKSCHIFKKNKSGRYIFGFFWIRFVQNGSNSQIQQTDISISIVHKGILEKHVFNLL